MNNDIIVRVGADTTELSRKLSNSAQKLANFGKANQRMFKSIGKAGDVLTKGITLPAVAAATALTGITLVKGFNRLVGIDTARAKLGALGHDAESVEMIMNNALDSVKGTSFGMDEAATAAASAVAAGIQPGKELTKYLGTMGDAAAIAGADFNEMAGIFNKVQTSQRAYTGDLNMLADRGIPIYQWLAEEAGVAEDAVYDMASNGEISAEMFRKSIEKNIGGAAKEIGEKSFAAAIKNVGADIGRIGANFLDAGGEGKGFFSVLKPLIKEFREYLSTLEDSATELGVKFGEGFMKVIDTIRELKSAYDSLDPAIQSFIKIGTVFGSIFLVALGPIMKLIGFIPAISSGLGIIAGIFGTTTGVLVKIIAISAGVVGVIIAIGAALIYAYKKSETFREIVNKAFEAIKEVVMNVVGAVVDFVLEIWGGMVDWWQENNELIMRVVQDGWSRLQKIIEVALMFIVPIVQDAWNMISMYIQIAWETIKTVVRVAVEFIKGIITAWLHVLDGDWSSAWETIKQTFSNVWEIIKGFASNITKIILDTMRERFESIKKTVTDKITEAKNNLVNKFTEMVRNVVTKGAEIVTTARNKFEEVKTAIRTKLTESVQAVAQLIGQMPGKVREKARLMVTAGADLIRGLINGIKNMGKQAVSAITGVVDGVINKAKSMLKISSPSKLFDQFGRWTGEGLANGITNTIGLVERVSERMSNAIIPDKKEIDLSYATPSGIRGSLSSAVSGTVDVNASSGNALLAEIRDELRRQKQMIIEMDGERVGRAVTPHVNEENAITDALRFF